MKYLLAIVVLIMSVFSVSAHFSLVNNHCETFSNSICDAEKKVSCDLGGWYCKPDSGSLLGDIYCNLGNPNIYDCSGSCDEKTGQCVGGNPKCVNGYMQCGLGDWYSANDDPYKCVSGNWVKQEECGDNPCKEISYTQAICNKPRYYCVGAVDCSWSENKGSNCFNTEQECKNNIAFYCFDKGTKVCTKKYGIPEGQCPSGLWLRGTNVDKAKCETTFNNIEDCKPWSLGLLQIPNLSCEIGDLWSNFWVSLRGKLLFGLGVAGVIVVIVLLILFLPYFKALTSVFRRFR